LEVKDRWKSSNQIQLDEDSDVNKDIDSILALYFDENNIPTMNLVDLYEKYFVGKDNLTSELKLKLKDVCFYFIYYVIPNMPSIRTEKPVVEWPKIQWLTDNWSSYNFKYPGSLSGRGLFQLLTSTKSSDSTGAVWDPNSGNSSGSNTDGSNSGGGGGSQISTNNNCAGGCPSNCFSMLLNKLNEIKNAKAAASTTGSSTPGVSTPGSAASYGWGSSNGYSDSDEVIPPANPSGKPVRGYYITNKPTNSKTDEGELSDFINNDIIKAHFNTNSDNKPTPYAISIFNNYVLYRNPIDDSHKNKLRDLIYYFIENIIPGLPTNDKPVSYVEWRPVYWLTNSYI
jgi:hypothetical protein